MLQIAQEDYQLFPTDSPFLIEEILDRATMKPFVTGFRTKLIGKVAIVWMGRMTGHPVSFEVINCLSPTEEWIVTSAVDSIELQIDSSNGAEYMLIYTKHSVYLLRHMVQAHHEEPKNGGRYGVC